MRKLYSHGAGTMLLGMATGASALEVKSGNDKVQVKLYGHLARAVIPANLRSGCWTFTLIQSRSANSH